MGGGKKRDNPTIPFELGASVRLKNKKAVSTKKAAKLVSKYIGYQDQEYAVIVTTDIKLRVIEIRVVGIGSAYQIKTNIRDLMRGAVVDGAYGIIMIHNHPTGKLRASPDDVLVAKALAKAGKILDIELLDSIIVHKKKYKSVI